MIWRDVRWCGGRSCESIFRRWAWWVAVVLAIGGCAMGGLTKDSSPEAKRAAVTERVNARWAALIKGDLDAAYALLSPTSRDTVPLATFKARKGSLQWRSATIESITCETESCKVDLTVTYDYPIQGTMMKGIQTPLSETWVLDKGTAWLVYL